MDDFFRDLDIPARVVTPEIPVPLDLYFTLSFDHAAQRLVLDAHSPGLSLSYAGRGRVKCDGELFRVPPLSLLDPFLSERRYIAARHIKIILRALLPKLVRDGVDIRCPLALHTQSAASVHVRALDGGCVHFDLLWRAPLSQLHDLSGFEGHVIAGNDIYKGRMRHLSALPFAFDGSYTLTGDAAAEFGRLSDLADYMFTGDAHTALRLLGRGIRYDIAENAIRRRAIEGLPPPEPVAIEQPRMPKKRVFDNPVLVGASIITQNRHSAAKFTPFVMEAKRLADVRGESAPHVAFSSFWPVYSIMSKEQRAWYFYWRTQFLSGRILECDLSYIFIFLYECVNRTSATADEGFSRMRAIWRAYRTAYPRLDRYIPDWCFDFILLNRLETPFHEIFEGIEPEREMLGSMPEVFFAARLEEGLHALPFTVLCMLSGYDITKSVYFNGREKQIAGAVQYALRELDAGMRASRGKPLLELLVPPALTLSWDSYRGAVCGRAASRRIELTYRPLARTGKLRTFTGDVFRCVENILRKRERFPGRLRSNLAPALASMLEKTLNSRRETAVQAAQGEPLKVDLSRALELENASWETTRLLLEASGQLSDIEAANEPPERLEREAPPDEMPQEYESDAQASKTAELSDSPEVDPLASFTAKLSPLEYDVLTALYHNAADSAITALTDAHFTFPDAVFESINERYLESFGDILIDSGEIIDDYRAQLACFIGELG